MKRAALLAVSLVALVGVAAAKPGPAPAPAIVDGDAALRSLPAAPVDRHADAGTAPVVAHPAGGQVIAADGVLRLGADGAVLWHHRQPDVIDVAVAGDGAIYALARAPGRGATTVRLLRLGADGARAWSVPLHRGRIDRRSGPDLTATVDGDAVLCSTVRRGRGAAIVVDRIGPSGRVRWSRAVAASGDCHAVVASADGDLLWAGHVAADGASRAALERLGPDGAPRWRQTFEAHPVVEELAIAADGDVVIGGVFLGRADLRPGPDEQVVTVDAYTTFVARFAADGAPRWARALDYSRTLVALLPRGADTLAVEAGRLWRLDATGRIVDSRAFGRSSTDGVLGDSYLSLTGATVDRDGAVVVVGALPEALLTGAAYQLFASTPYLGPRGPFVARLPR